MPLSSKQFEDLCKLKADAVAKAKLFRVGMLELIGRQCWELFATKNGRQAHGLRVSYPRIAMRLFVRLANKSSSYAFQNYFLPTRNCLINEQIEPRPQGSTQSLGQGLESELLQHRLPQLCELVREIVKKRESENIGRSPARLINDTKILADLGLGHLENDEAADANLQVGTFRSIVEAFIEAEMVEAVEGLGTFDSLSDEELIQSMIRLLEVEVHPLAHKYGDFVENHFQDLLKEFSSSHDDTESGSIAETAIKLHKLKQETFFLSASFNDADHLDNYLSAIVKRTDIDHINEEKKKAKPTDHLSNYSETGLLQSDAFPDATWHRLGTVRRLWFEKTSSAKNLEKSECATYLLLDRMALSSDRSRSTTFCEPISFEQKRSESHQTFRMEVPLVEFCIELAETLSKWNEEDAKLELIELNNNQPVLSVAWCQVLKLAEKRRATNKTFLIRHLLAALQEIYELKNTAALRTRKYRLKEKVGKEPGWVFDASIIQQLQPQKNTVEQ